MEPFTIWLIIIITIVFLILLKQLYTVVYDVMQRQKEVLNKVAKIVKRLKEGDDD